MLDRLVLALREARAAIEPALEPAGLLRGERATPRPAPRPTADPRGPVQPQDVPELEDIPLGGGRTTIGMRENGAVLSTDIRGVPFEVTVDRDGLRVNPQPRNRERELAEEAPEPIE